MRDLRVCLYLRHGYYTLESSPRVSAPGPAGVNSNGDNKVDYPRYIGILVNVPSKRIGKLLMLGLWVLDRWADDD